MKTLIIFLYMLVVVPVFHIQAQEQQAVPYTLADRDRAIRTEIKLEALETKMDAKFDAINTKFDSVNTKFDSMNSRIDFVFWVLGLLAALVLFNLGYTIWDRRTALKPAIEKADAADFRSINISRALRD
jgi:hypothetical protein